jgi:hypothetical protein
MKKAVGTHAQEKKEMVSCSYFGVAPKIATFSVRRVVQKYGESSYLRTRMPL